MLVSIASGAAGRAEHLSACRGAATFRSSQKAEVLTHRCLAPSAHQHRECYFVHVAARDLGPCCAGGGTRTHKRSPSPDFESDKDLGMVRDSALRGAFMSLFESLCEMVRDHVRPDRHQNSHQKNMTLKPDKRASRYTVNPS